jgi:hypothetical protein
VKGIFEIQGSDVVYGNFDSEACTVQKKEQPDSIVASSFPDSLSAMLGSKFALPAYIAVMECVPTESEETVSCAEFPANVALPREVEPSRNVTVPVAVVPAVG